MGAKRLCGSRKTLATAHRDHDLERVALLERLVGVAAARDDFAVALQRDALARELQAREQFRAIERCGEFAALAVDGDRDHAELPGRCIHSTPRRQATSTAATTRREYQNLSSAVRPSRKLRSGAGS